MKKFAALFLASIIIIGLTACAGSTHKGARVKCPACGYEFEPASK